METHHQTLIDTMRKFNRFYADILNFLNRYTSQSDFTPSEACILQEIGATKECTSKKLAGALQMDAGYLSRTVKHLEKKGLIAKRQSSSDGRLYYLSLTETGTQALAKLDELSVQQAYDLVAHLKERNRKGLIKGMKMIEDALGENLHVLHKSREGLRPASKAACAKRLHAGHPPKRQTANP